MWEEFNKGRVLLVAAGATFYLLLALRPRFRLPTMAYLGGLLPSGGWTSFRSQLQALARQKPSALGTGFFIGLRIAFWTSNSGMKALFWGHEHRLRGTRRTQLQARPQTDRQIIAP
ncbi:hypothetical protein [Mesorhizobium huakuii]|uniref:Uncharacterized protein n=1 Tax=Mesorhizobium huakuii TaxID=28104 RepID=A0ABZ0VR77_9HYPH|nr:hypothetical protein [Mesorhizobium huakuii]WQB99176.1 hypothetical protein U0R22_003349 [Mesorhizobium huakuii]